MEIVLLREDYFCSNTYLMIKNNNAVIVDCGVSLSTIEEAVMRRGNPKIVGIFLTHAHFDHILSLKDCIDKWNCPVYIHEKGVDNLSNPLNNYSQFTDKIIKIVSPNIIALPKTEFVKLENFEIQFLYTPGHTDDCVCYVVDDVMFTGDTIFDGCIGRTDLANSSALHMHESLKLLYNSKPCEYYFPGHGRTCDKEQMQKFLISIID